MSPGSERPLSPESKTGSPSKRRLSLKALFPYSALGLCIGLWIGLDPISGPGILCLLLSLPLLFLSYKRGGILPFLLTLLIGTGIGAVRISTPLGVSEYVGVVVETKENYFLFQSGVTRFYVYEKDNLRETGDWLYIKGKVSEYVTTTYESRFDFGDYLFKKGVRYQLSSYETTVKWSMPLRLKEKEKEFLSNFEEETAALLDSILFNRKDYSSKTVSSASQLGLINLLSQSGFLYGALLMAIGKVASWKMDEGKASAVTFVAATLLLPLGITKLGIVKAYLVRGIRLINNVALRKRLQNLDILGISALFLIFFDFHNVYQSGYLLGFSVSLLSHFTRSLINRKKPIWRGPARFMLLLVWMVPTTIKMSGGIHLFYPLHYVVTLPLAELFSLLGLFSFLFVPLKGTLNCLTSAISWIMTVMANTDPMLRLPADEWFSAPFYAVFLLCLVIHEYGDLRIRNAIVVTSVCLYSITLLPISPLLTQEVTFINVGQGDSILIRDGLDTVLVDTGGSTYFDMAEECLIPYLRKRRIYHIDTVIGTHGDFDHVGAKDSLLSNYKVGKYIDDASSFPYRIGNIEFRNLNTYSMDGENESSLVLDFELMGRKWLLMGDAPTSIEEKILIDNPTLDCDILKVGHHGSDTSSSLRFLKTVTPIEAVISVGAKNSYGHPSASIVKRLTSLGIKVRRTDEEGTITYKKMRKAL